MAHQLRYCPLCLAQHGYYRLTWRFVPIEGCHEHGCRLLDRCGHCGQPVPFLTYLPQWGICPTCAGDLRTCPVEYLDEPQRAQVQTRTRDFEYLIRPQPFETSGEQLIKRIGEQFARWRAYRGLSIVKVARAMKQNPPIFSYLENGSLPRGLGFRQYLNYADFLQISLWDIFETRAPDPPPPVQSDEDTRLTKIRQAVVVLEQQGQRVTQTKVSQMIGVNMSVFIKYPQIKAFWAEYRRQVRRQWEQETIEQVQQAASTLKQRGQGLTTTAIRQLQGNNQPMCVLRISYCVSDLRNGIRNT